MDSPLITIAVPSFNQGCYLEEALQSIFSQGIPVEVCVIDGGSSDNSVEIIKRWEKRLFYWRSRPDEGQADAINEGIAKGTAPFVCWLNSDDWLIKDKVNLLLNALNKSADAPMVYGEVLNYNQKYKSFRKVNVEPFDEHRLAIRCIISQPATLIRRSVWESVGGVDKGLSMAMDYDLWWRIYKKFGKPLFLKDIISVNRDHLFTKTNSQRSKHYKEAIHIVGKYYGSVPFKWYLYWPYAVWIKQIISNASGKYENITYL